MEGGKNFSQLIRASSIQGTEDDDGAPKTSSCLEPEGSHDGNSQDVASCRAGPAAPVAIGTDPMGLASSPASSASLEDTIVKSLRPNDEEKFPWAASSPSQAAPDASLVSWPTGAIKSSAQAREDDPQQTTIARMGAESVGRDSNYAAAPENTTAKRQVAVTAVGGSHVIANRHGSHQAHTPSTKSTTRAPGGARATPSEPRTPQGATKKSIPRPKNPSRSNVGGQGHEKKPLTKPKPSDTTPFGNPEYIPRGRRRETLAESTQRWVREKGIDRARNIEVKGRMELRPAEKGRHKLRELEIPSVASRRGASGQGARLAGGAELDETNISQHSSPSKETPRVTAVIKAAQVCRGRCHNMLGLGVLFFSKPHVKRLGEVQERKETDPFQEWRAAALQEIEDNPLRIREPGSMFLLLEILLYGDRAHQTRLLEVFREFDKDVDCKLHRHEVRRLAKHLYPGVTRAELWYFMIMLDVGGHLRTDGITYKDMVTSVRECCAARKLALEDKHDDTRRRLHSLWHELHPDGCENVSIIENFASSRGRLTYIEIARMCRGLLVKLRRYELRNMLTRLSVLDRGLDGEVDTGVFEQYLRQFK
eukprot:scaffold1786_cov398-Prasinococcus_capsulatus_cf.AAC.21